MNQKAWDMMKLEMMEQFHLATNDQWKMSARHTLRLMLKIEKELGE